MQIKAVFDNPNMVDADDLVSIKFNSAEKFVDEANGISIAPGTELYVRMGP